MMMDFGKLVIVVCNMKLTNRHYKIKLIFKSHAKKQRKQKHEEYIFTSFLYYFAPWREMCTIYFVSTCNIVPYSTSAPKAKSS